MASEITYIKNVDLKSLLALLAQFNNADYEAIDLAIKEDGIAVIPVKELKITPDENPIKPKEGDEEFGGVIGL